MSSTPQNTNHTNLPSPPSLTQTLGPSFILVGLALGSGELILWPYLAATYGLGLIWGGLLGITLQYFLNTEAMRYTLAWGESVFVGFRRLSRLIPIWFILSTFIPWSLPGFSSASAQILGQLFPNLGLKLSATILLLLVGFLLTVGKTLYKTMETIQKGIVFTGIPFIIILCFLLTKQEHWLATAQGLIGRGEGWWLFPEGVAIASFLGAFAYSGGGGNLNLSQSSYIKEKGHGMGRYSEKIRSLLAGEARPIRLTGQLFSNTAANRKRWKEWWGLICLEHGIVFWGLGLFTILLLATLAYALVYGHSHPSGINFLFTESVFIGERLFPAAGTFYLLMAALMLFSTQLVVLESTSRIISENVALLTKPLKQRVNLSLGFYLALWGQIGLGIVFLWSGLTEPRLLLTGAAVLNAAAMMVAFPLLFFLNRRFLPEHARPGKLRQTFIWLGFLFFAFFLTLLLREHLT